MRCRHRIAALAALACLLAATSAWGRADEDWKEVTPQDLPAPVFKSLRISYPKDDIDKVFVGFGLESGVYRALMRNGSGGRIVVYLNDGGVILGGRDMTLDVAVGALPQPVAAALKKVYPEGHVRYAQKLGGDTAPRYEVRLDDGMGRVWATFAPGGDVLEVLKEVPQKELPAAVAKAVQADYPGSRMHWAAQVNDHGKAVGYEVLVVPAEANPLALRLRVSADGRVTRNQEVTPPGRRE